MRFNFRLILELTLILMFIRPPADTIGQEYGPLCVLNQFPPHMIFLTPRPHSPRPLAMHAFSGALSVDYISVYSNAASSDHKILMDMEAMVVDLRFGYGLTDRLSAWARMPAVSMQDGVLDSPLKAYHDLFDLPNYGKEKSPKNEFAYLIETEGRPWFDADKGGLNPMDLTLGAQVDLFDLRNLFFKQINSTDIGLTTEVKLPTGDARRGFGSGAIDCGLFLPVKFGFSRFNLYVMPGYIHVGRPDIDRKPIAVRDVASVFIGGEYLFSPRLCLLAQVNSYTPPFAHTGLAKLDTPSAELAVGARWPLKSNGYVEFAFCEDLSRAGPDFDLHFSICFNMGP